MNKKISKFLGILILLVLAQYGASAQNGGFEISFDIKGIEPSDVYHTFFGAKDAGSAEVEMIGNGRFVLKGELNSSVVARIGFAGVDALRKSPDGRGYYPMKSAYIWMILSPGAKFNVTGDLTGKDFVDIYPATDDENNFFAGLNSKIMPLINENGNIMLEMARNKEMDESRKALLQGRAKEIAGQIQQYKLDFLSQRPNSIAALWLMEDMLVRSELEVSVMADLFAKVNQVRFQGNYFFEAVKSRVEAADLVAIGKVCPEISTDASVDGTVVSLSDYRGKFVIIDFWGTWCGPCMAGVPHMKAFRDKYAGKLEIFGVSNDKKVDVWKASIEKNGMNWPNILIGTGEKDFVAKFNVQGFPTKILISPEGIILHRESGERDTFYQKVEEFISRIN